MNGDTLQAIDTKLKAILVVLLDQYIRDTGIPK